MNDQDLDERLVRAGEQFRANAVAPPSLDAMLDVALRPRHGSRVWPAVAACVIAVAGVAVVVPLTRSAGNGHRPAPSVVPATPAPTITRDGTQLHYVGDEGWQDPVLGENDPEVVDVYAEVQKGGQASWGTYCTITPIARVVSQTSTAVTVAVGMYAAPPSKSGARSRIACTDIRIFPVRIDVALDSALGSRSLIDAQDGATRTVLDPATVLKPADLPAGYTGGQAAWADEHQPAGTAVRLYQGSGGALTVTVGSASINRPLSHIVEHTTVRGHPATVSYSSGFDQDILIAWNEDATHAATLYQMSSYDKAHPALTVDQLVQIANSLR
jgi:hypothetical protein